MNDFQRDLSNALKRASNFPGNPASRGLQALFAVLGLGFVGYNSMFTVEGGHAAIIFNRITGLKATVYESGTKFLIPFVEQPIIFNVRTTPKIISSPTGSKG
jgi:regulator of protease activity HflC (stomatin/prohibitin superfamily)